MHSFVAIAAMVALLASSATVAVAQPANRDANTPAVNTPNSPPTPGDSCLRCKVTH
jgi:hypothetical protein